MKNPISSQKYPSKVKVNKGTTYFWCSCGLSSKQPFCDGSHQKAGNSRPIRYEANSNKVVFFCNCKLTKNPPFCDNSHISNFSTF